MDVFQAIRKRRAVRNYSDQPVPDEVLDRVLSHALRAPTGSGAQDWGFVVVRDAEKRKAVGELIIQGGAQYFAIMRPKKDETTDEEHAQWGREYAAQIMASYTTVPVWIIGLVVPRHNYPEKMKAGGWEDDLISLAFAFENLMLAARAEGLGTVPTTAFQRFEKDRLREILGIPPEVDPAIVSPLGYPVQWPTGLAPALQRNFQSWHKLVHDDAYGATRA